MTECFPDGMAGVSRTIKKESQKCSVPFFNLVVRKDEKEAKVRILKVMSMASLSVNKREKSTRQKIADGAVPDVTTSDCRLPSAEEISPRLLPFNALRPYTQPGQRPGNFTLQASSFLGEPR